MFVYIGYRGAIEKEKERFRSDSLLSIRRDTAGEDAFLLRNEGSRTDAPRFRGVRAPCAERLFSQCFDIDIFGAVMNTLSVF